LQLWPIAAADQWPGHPGTVSFGRAEFSGGEVLFIETKFWGSAVDFSHASTWPHPTD